ncbi:MAG: hypothetical protein HY286_13540 [Planctomycetes bacterium]|nr:hypothetical protein [Planctomycetota bacterium]
MRSFNSPAVSSRALAAALFFVSLFGIVVFSCAAPRAEIANRMLNATADAADGKTAHLDQVMRADFCAKCHPEAVAEHRMNTHGRAFSDIEARMATAGFSIPGCIDCHTPRPIFETGIGRNPIKRLHHLEEGNDCFSCHAKAEHDYTNFNGGLAECKNAFDPRVGQVEACASCHRNHGTPYQWENAKFGKQAGNVCIDCHMPEVERPVAVGMPAKKTRRHTFFASRSETQLKMAYEYKVELQGNEVVVHLTNAGTGHNFPTELKQRSVESLVIIRDTAGREIARSRDVHRDPYKRPYGLTLPVNTQIPSGETREHRVPVPISAGTVETQLFYKLYYPMEDGHPDLSRTLESRSFAFGPIEPSTKTIESAPEIHAVLPEALPVEAASPGNLADFARPKIAKVDINVPGGTQPGDIEKLIALFQFPVPEANKKAGDALVKLGEKAVPALVGTLGSWDSKTWAQGEQALIRIGAPAAAAVVGALENRELYIRVHACEILARFDKDTIIQAGAQARLEKLIKTGAPLDRCYGSDAAGRLGLKELIPAIRANLSNMDFDVAAAAARAVGVLNDKDSTPLLRKTLARVAAVAETGRDVAWALAAVGEIDGARWLLDHLDYPDDLVRASLFEAFLDVTGIHGGYHPNLDFEHRLEALAALRQEFIVKSAGVLRKPRSLAVHGALKAEILKLVRDAGGNDVNPSDPAETEKCISRLIEIGRPAAPYVIDGLKWPAGFLDKRVAMLRVLEQFNDPDAVPAAIEATRDPALTTALWAARVLEVAGDPRGAKWIIRLNRRFDDTAAANKLPGNLGSPEEMRILLGRGRARLGDEDGARLLLRLLFSGEAGVRAGAEQALLELYGNAETTNSPLADEVRATLAKLPQLRSGQLAAMRETWQKLDEIASDAAGSADTREKRIAALTKFDFAEESATRYHVLDPRAFSVDFHKTTMAADGLSQQLFDDAAFKDSIASRELTSTVERRGWAQSSSGLSSEFSGDSLTIEAAADGGGSMTFGLGGPGGFSVPMEWWRDYELTFDVTIERKGFWILDRYDPIWAIYYQTAFTTVAPEAVGVLHAPVQDGMTYRVTHSVVGNDVIHLWSALRNGVAGEAQDVRGSMPLKVRKGGLVFQLEAGAKVMIRNLRLKIFRVDAAEIVNAIAATPGR